MKRRFQVEERRGRGGRSREVGRSKGGQRKERWDGEEVRADRTNRDKSKVKGRLGQGGEKRGERSGRKRAERRGEVT